MQKPRVGVIGVGKMGRLHARGYAKLESLCKFAGVYDVNHDAAAAVARDYGVAAFPSAEALLDEVDAVTVAAPTKYHFQLAKAALRAGVHVLIEKPVCHTVAEAQRLYELTKHYDRTVQVGHIERFNPAVQQLAPLLRNKHVIAIEVRRTGPYDPRVQDLDVIQDMMVHDIDVLAYLFGSEVTDVAAHARRVKSPVFADHAVSTVTLDNGIIATLTASRVTEQKARVMNLTCEEAYIEMDYMERRLLLSRDTVRHEANGVAPAKLEQVGERILVPDQDPLLAQTEHFLQCVVTGQRPLIGIKDALSALEVVERIQEQVYESTLPLVDHVAV